MLRASVIVLLVAMSMKPLHGQGELFEYSGANGGSNNPVAVDGGFDLNGDGVVTVADQVNWLHTAAVANGLTEPYAVADGNLDGIVDEVDFAVWNSQRFRADTGWCGGDWNADGVTDVSDFNLWNSNRAASSMQVPVPEPRLWSLLLVVLVLLPRIRGRQIS